MSDNFFLPGFEAIHPPSTENALWRYLQDQEPDTFRVISQAAAPEVLEIFAHNIRSLVGNLPPEQFGVQIVTNRENIARMLSGAMMGGYFLHMMEQRMRLEQVVSITADAETDDTP